MSPYHQHDLDQINTNDLACVSKLHIDAYREDG